MLSFDDDVADRFEDAYDVDIEGAVATEQAVPSSQRKIERAAQTDEIPTLIRLINLRVDPVNFGLKADPAIKIPFFLALRTVVIAEMFAEDPKRLFEKARKGLKMTLSEARSTPAYAHVKQAVLGAIDYIYSVEGIGDAAKKFEPNIARSMTAVAMEGTKEGNKVLLDLADRAAPKPQRTDNKQIVFVMPGGSHEGMDEVRKLAESVHMDGSIDGSVLNVPKVG